MMLTATHLLFSTVVERPIVLNEHKGSAIRGAFFHALRGRGGNRRWPGFCANKAVAECADCPLLLACPVARLLATHDPACTWGDQLPRPTTVRPPLSPQARYMPGDQLDFGVTVVGDAANLLPYIIMAVEQGMPAEGLGKRDKVNEYRPGHFRLQAVDLHHPLRQETHRLWDANRGAVTRAQPSVTVTHDDVLAHAHTLPADRLTLRLLTPMRLIDDKKLVRSFRFRPFLQRLMERLSLLSMTVGEGNFFPDDAERRALLAAAEKVEVTDGTDWVKLRSYSTRKKSETMLSGLVGDVTLEGDLTPFLPWLVWGEQVHVGKNAVKGDGWYELLRPAL